MTKKNIATQDLLNIIYECTQKLHDLNDYAEEEIDINDCDLSKISEALQNIKKLEFVMDIPF